MWLCCCFLNVLFFLFLSAKIGLFYLVFYAGLAAFFAVMLVIFYQTLSNFEPKWKLDSSLIGTNPGKFLLLSSSFFATELWIFGFSVLELWMICLL